MGNAAQGSAQIQEILDHYPSKHLLTEGQEQRKIYKAAKKKTEFSHHVRQPNVIKSLNFKIQGNVFIQQKEYKKAIESYTQAINLFDKDSIYFSNRSVANKLLNRFQEAKSDAQQALHIDPRNSRAHFIYGTIILIEVQMYPDIGEILIKQAQQGIKELELGNYEVYLAIQQNDQKNKLRVLINQNLAKGKRMQYLIRKEIDKKNMNSLKQTLTDVSRRQNCQINMNYIDNLLSRSTDIAIPEYYVCPITYEIINEPVLLNSGMTYEKQSIHQQFRQNGFIDPITREEIDPFSVVPNIQLIEGIKDIRSKYGWIGIEDEKDYKAIKFE